MVLDLLFGCALFVGFALFSLEVHAFHGADSLFYLVPGKASERRVLFSSLLRGVRGDGTPFD